MGGLVHHPGPVLRWGVGGSRAGYCSRTGDPKARSAAFFPQVHLSSSSGHCVLPVTADSWSGDVGGEKVVGVMGDQ